MTHIQYAQECTSRGEETLNTTDVATTFGVMFDIAVIAMGEQLLQHYRSDLWHDAEFLSRFIGETEATFYWSLRECGTHIGTSTAHVFHGSAPADQHYKIMMNVIERNHLLEIVRLP